MTESLRTSFNIRFRGGDGAVGKEENVIEIKLKDYRGRMPHGVFFVTDKRCYDSDFLSLLALLLYYITNNSAEYGTSRN